ncbi:tyrosine-type recombinase/integrase [Kutzneria buriramensis]|uniref:Site-specific recombinase XerD n=1 Tax=Kutzneria buriramensis TaxID=1045776 RepID=A0A3E0HFM5_9PSEU|nr:tyrosine-type recombinase/integrase [Kutzneria buriramensis]REH43605.1 site-specific recombinase XerD [Kutzneria buriramensis]
MSSDPVSAKDTARRTATSTADTLTAEDLTELLDSWLLHLRAERKSKQTVKNYRDGVRRFLVWSAEARVEPTLTKPVVNQFVADLIEAGAEGSTAVSRQLAVRQFSKWLADEGEIDRDELLGLKRPKLDEKVIEPLTDEQLIAFFAACKGKEFRDRRDEALARTMAETMCRSDEALNMTVSDTDLKRGLAVIRRGKGGKGRLVPFGAKTGVALDRYLRMRRTHRLAGTNDLWLGARGKGFGYYGLYVALTRRAEMAGIPDFHPHRLRATGATNWLAAGGSEGGLMAVAGWARPDMLLRYTKFTRNERAIDEARGLNLGDL